MAQRRYAIVVSAIAVGLVSAHYLGVLSPVERLAEALLQPLGRASRTILRTFSYSGNVPSTPLKDRIAKLEEHNERLSVENTELKTSLNAAREASGQQAFIRNRKLKGVTGRIFAQSGDPTTAYVVIDVGRREGVEQGSPAIVGQGIIVGSVVSVSADSARILLTTDNRSSFTGTFVDAPTAQGVVRGIGGLSLRMDLIAQSEQISVGQIVTSSGSDPQVPRGLILGTVDRIEKQQGALFQSATLQPLFHIPRLDAISVLITPTP